VGKIKRDTLYINEAGNAKIYSLNTVIITSTIWLNTPQETTISGNTGKKNWSLTDEEFEQATADVAASVERAHEEERLLTAAAEEAEQLDAQRMVEDTMVTEANAL
jgi:hypothetical protein